MLDSALASLGCAGKIKTQDLSGEADALPKSSDLIILNSGRNISTDMANVLL